MKSLTAHRTPRFTRSVNKSERLENQIMDLESDYLNVLFSGLKVCTAGRWGLFGHNEHPTRRRSETPPELQQLVDLAESINRARAKLGEAPFALHDEFMAARGKPAPNDVGEPRQAKEWLTRLGLSEP